MAAPGSPDRREFRQMRHDVDDVYRLLAATQDTVQSTREAVGAVWSAVKRHDTRFEEIQQALDLQNARLDRVADAQRQQGETQRHQGEVQRQQGEVQRQQGESQRQQGEAQRQQGEAQRQQGERLARIEDTQQQQGDRLVEILTLLRGRQTS